MWLKCTKFTDIKNAKKNKTYEKKKESTKNKKFYQYIACCNYELNMTKQV